MLKSSRIHRRLLRTPPEYWSMIFHLIHQIHSYLHGIYDECIVDSCPLPVCHPCRSWRCKIYQGKEYLGYCAAKKMYYYGLNLHLIVSKDGVIVEFMFTPASWSDITALKAMTLDLPTASYQYGDKASSAALTSTLRIA